MLGKDGVQSVAQLMIDGRFCHKLNISEGPPGRSEHFDITNTDGDMIFSPGGADINKWVLISDIAEVFVPRNRISVTTWQKLQ